MKTKQKNFFLILLFGSPFHFANLKKIKGEFIRIRDKLESESFET